MSALTVGIDLGTTYTAVAIYEQNRVQVISDGQGNRTTPSVVTYLQRNEPIVGELAMTKRIENPASGVAEVKRLIGRHTDDLEFLSRTRSGTLPFTPEADDNGMVNLVIKIKNEEFRVPPEQISAHILDHIMNVARRYKGPELKRAVITVPAYFTGSQLEATKAAAEIAGIEVVHLLKEPCAAAIAYGMKAQSGSEPKTLLIYDLGGGTFDVSIMVVNDREFDVKVYDGDSYLGGVDFDETLVAHYAEHIKSEFNVELDGRAKLRLREACELAKRSLSTGSETRVTVSSLFNQSDYTRVLTRAKFNELCEPMFRRTIDIVKQALINCNMRPTDIDEIVMVGGSTRIPRIKELVKDLFGGVPLCEHINPDEAVAYGAAIHAALLEADDNDRRHLKDILPHALGIIVTNPPDRVSHIIPKSTRIPFDNTKEYATSEDNQTVARIEIMEGDGETRRDCTKLGEFLLKNMPKKPKGVVKIDCQFKVDRSGILTATATERSTTVTNSVQIDKRQLSRADIEKAIRELESTREAQRERREEFDAKTELENHCEQLIQQMMKMGINNDQMRDAITETLRWTRDTDRSTLNEIERRKAELGEQLKQSCTIQ